jgi:hypothetical protein
MRFLWLRLDEEEHYVSLVEETKKT